MDTEDARYGACVRVSDRHIIPTRRGMVGKVVGLYGGRKYLAMEVRFPNGEQILFHPEDLAKTDAHAEPTWWSSLRGTG